MILLDVFVPGTPAPKGSMRSVRSRTTGKTVTLHDNKRTVPWGKAMADTFRLTYRGEPWDGPVEVCCRFWIDPPASDPDRKGPHAVKPDVDKLCRCVLDSLKTAGVLSEDSRVAFLDARKYWTAERYSQKSGVAVEVTAL